MFPDETGVLLTPVVRSTWAPRGATPPLVQAMRARRKLSVMGWLCVSPDRRRVRLYLAFFADGSIDGDVVRHLLEALLRHLRGPVVVVWDSLGAHRGDEMDEFLEAHRRLRVYAFPPYCPELNPTEQLWRWLKWDRLANCAPPDVATLEAHAAVECRPACSNQQLLRSFIALSELPLDLEPP